MSSNFDNKCLDLAIKNARKAFSKGNYPVGAVLSFNSKIAGVQENLGKTNKSLVYHAENSLIISKGDELLRAHERGDTISLYSTLEPCLMCLGSAVLNKVNRIIYIETDPHAGACGVNIKTLGKRYEEIWPEIIQKKVSKIPYKLIMKFLEKEKEHGNKKWAEHMISLFGGKQLIKKFV